MSKSTRNKSFLSKSSILLFTYTLIAQTVAVAMWLLMHLQRLDVLPLIFVLVGSLSHFILGINLLGHIKSRDTSGTNQLLLIVPGISSSLITFAGIAYVLAPILVQIPLLGGLAVLCSYFVLGFLFTNNAVLGIWLASSALASLYLALMPYRKR
ncbi:MAG: hypothetical protein QG549_300 [Patescibacteria group bacterium]|nr:hypothetical protein [Patescibacteria group bacterium]